ncbi:AIM24 family protein [Dichelobacter nodosus]|uniref:AIM24 family protein n=1 Tax=Dichelobacter nodosus TaxID=870 RepID=UPI00107E9F64|nr:AIM24 family protein [Dichelobacter nodosus]TGA65958.1 AIM24 family protein [Dichelobacter nodosus]
MYQISNFLNNDDIVIKSEKGPFKVIEYKRDLSVMPQEAVIAFFSSKMNIRKRQLYVEMDDSRVTLQAGAMQWTLGAIDAVTGITGVGDLFSKAIKSQLTKESAIKPEYAGSGILVTEPTYKHLIISSLDEWNGSVVLDDGLFFACDARIKQGVVMRSNLSSAALGNEGLFNLALTGNDECFVVESPVPREELIEVDLQNDQIKIDGALAIAWSSTLKFTVERAGKTLLGSAASGEGLVNVYKGTGKIWMTPVC